MSPRLPTEKTEITKGETQVRTKGGLMPTVWKHKCKVYMLSDINQQPTVENFLINGKHFQAITNTYVASERKHR